MTMIKDILKKLEQIKLQVLNFNLEILSISKVRINDWRLIGKAILWVIITSVLISPFIFLFYVNIYEINLSFFKGLFSVQEQLTYLAIIAFLLMFVYLYFWEIFPFGK